MARLARVVAPGVPHHITQRGNRRQQTFFSDDDYRLYLDLMAEWCAHYGVAIWAYCLMPNHVHLIAVPDSEAALGLAIGEAHRRYSRHVNFREDWRGHLWQGRFASFPMDERYLLAAARYVELNPLRAGLVKHPKDYAWSSARAHLQGGDDGLVKAAALLDIVPDWASFLDGGLTGDDRNAIRQHERTGRPLGGEGFVGRLEGLLDRTLKKKKPGPRNAGVGGGDP
jgi:putative transposase